ncbi:hypothetical protein [Micromonospora sp. NPDC126480]|uniref:hypothetical protein n=1 Tax=Micromonospora sp. NPDC126480 TaxID=3155312 RepID=UPI00333427AA
MPAPVATDDTRNPSLLTALFWVGVALAPVAALILLVADGNGPLRFAAVLAILAVVLIGLSIALRADGGSGGEELREEIEQLRRELRGELVAAAQRGNQAMEQAQRAQEAVVALRRRLDAGTAALSGSAEVGGRARVPAEDPVGRAHVPDGGRWDEQDDDRGRRAEDNRGDRPSGSAGVYGGDRQTGGYGGERTGGVYGGDRPASGGYGGDRPASGDYGGDRPASGGYGGDRQTGGYGGERTGGVYGGDRPAAGVYGSGERSAGVYGAERTGASHGGWSPEPEGQAAPRPLGVVRHTETVHVTTRHTIVDGADLGGTGTRYGGYGGRRSSGGEERSWAGDGDDHRSWSGPGPADDRSWSGRDERARDDHGWAGSDEPARSGQQWDDHGWTDQRDDRSWGEKRSWDDPADQHGRVAAPDGGAEGEYWSQLRAGDRWAAVRADDRGRELRMGERRAEVLADESGAEFRVADRWAAVRRDEPGRDREESWRGGWNEPEDRPALPSGGVPVPDEWRVPRQRQPEPQWAPEPGRYGSADDRWR